MRRIPRPPSSSRAFLVAVVLHVVVGAAFLQWMTLGRGIPSWLRLGGEPEAIPERITYVTPVPRPTTPPSTLPQERQTMRPRPDMVAADPASPAAPLVMPRGTPRDTGSGAPRGDNGIGALDPNVRGVKPGYTDERVWRGTPGPGAYGVADGTGAPRGDRADKIDSIMAGVLTAARDSLDSIARAQGRTGRQPGDWTKTDANGNRWGWDQQGIRLGKVTIPNALLALLPLNAATAANMSGNMSRMDADRRLAASRADIQRMSERGIGEAEFRRVVKEMDARRDAERRERLRAPSASVAAPVKSSDKSNDR
ncbi:MAG: hypothetical protein RLZZ621_2299 [Gemmatimonadota bacterium]